MAQGDSSRLSDKVFQYLNDGIASRKWKVGDKLPTEAELCRELHASRTTVRSALNRLAGLQLVESIQGKGTFVCAPPALDGLNIVLQLAPTDLLNIFEFRKIMECECVALAAIRASMADITEMEKTIVAMEAGRSQEDVASQDMAFHRLIAKATGNVIMIHVFDALSSAYTRMFAINVSQMGNLGVEQHRRILLAIRTRDMDAARKCMLDHLETTMRLICGS